MLTYPAAIFLLIMVVWGCSKPHPDTLKSDTLTEIINDLAYENTIRLNGIEYVVEENGNRKADVELLRKFKNILFYPLGNNYNLPEEADSVDLSELDDYTGHLIREAEQYDWEYVVPEAVERLKKSETIFHESRSQLDYDILTLNLFLLKKAFIDQAFENVGVMGLIEYGLVQMTYASDTLKKDKKFTALLTPMKHLEENIIEVGQGYVLLTNNDQEIQDYTLEYVGMGGWIFSFVPRESGIYRFKFGFTAHSKVDRFNPGYPFHVERNLYVE